MNGRRVLLVLIAMMLLPLAASAQAVKASFGVTGGGVATLMSETQPATSNPVYLNGYGGAFMTMKFGRDLRHLKIYSLNQEPVGLSSELMDP